MMATGTIIFPAFETKNALIAVGQLINTSNTSVQRRFLRPSSLLVYGEESSKHVIPFPPPSLFPRETAQSTIVINQVHTLLYGLAAAHTKSSLAAVRESKGL